MGECEWLHKIRNGVMLYLKLKVGKGEGEGEGDEVGWVSGDCQVSRATHSQHIHLYFSLLIFIASKHRQFNFMIFPVSLFASNLNGCITF